MRNIRDRRFVLCLALILGGSSLSAPSQNDQRQSAITLEQQGKTPEAEAAWKTVSKHQPSNPEPYAHLGLLEARQEHYAEAIRFYRKAFALNPGMPSLRLNLGLSLFKSGDYKQAIPMFEPLLKSQPDDQRLNVLMGMSYYGLAQYSTASSYLKRATKTDTQNLTLLLTLAHSCLLSQQYQCVLDAFHRIIALSPESAEAHMLAGEALDEMKEPVDAVRELRAAVVANPKEPNVHFGLGYLLWTQGNTQEAAHEFQAELDNVPEHGLAMLYLADAEIQMNHMEEARPLLEKVVKVNPVNSKGHLDLGIVYAEAGQQEDALRELKQAVALKPDDVDAHYRLARLYRSMGKTAEAKAEFDKSKSLNKTADEKLLKVMSQVPHRDSGPQGAAAAPAVK